MNPWASAASMPYSDRLSRMGLARCWSSSDVAQCCSYEGDYDWRASPRSLRQRYFRQQSSVAAASLRTMASGARSHRHHHTWYGCHLYPHAAAHCGSWCSSWNCSLSKDYRCWCSWPVRHSAPFSNYYLLMFREPSSHLLSCTWVSRLVNSCSRHSDESLCFLGLIYWCFWLVVAGKPIEIYPNSGWDV